MAPDAHNEIGAANAGQGSAQSQNMHVDRGRTDLRSHRPQGGNQFFPAVDDTRLAQQKIQEPVRCRTQMHGLITKGDPKTVAIDFEIAMYEHSGCSARALSRRPRVRSHPNRPVM